MGPPDPCVAAADMREASTKRIANLSSPFRSCLHLPNVFLDYLVLAMTLFIEIVEKRVAR